MKRLQKRKNRDNTIKTVKAIAIGAMWAGLTYLLAVLSLRVMILIIFALI